MRETAVILMIVTIFSKVLGFGREIVLSYFYGASNISDAYLVSLTIPSVIFGFISMGLSTAYIPMYSKIQMEHGEKNSIRYSNNIINILMILCTFIILLTTIFAEPIVKIFASGFEGETLELTINLMKISLFSMYFWIIVSIISCYLQLKGNYITPALIGLPMNVIVVISILLSVKTNVIILSIGFVIAIATQVVLLVISAYKKGYRYSFIIDLNDKYIKKMLFISIPVIIGVSVDQINTLADRTIASSIIAGGISSLNYANRLNGFVQGLFVSSINTVMYPIISKMIAEDNTEKFKDYVSESISFVNLLVLPVTIGALVFSEPIVKLLFGRGAFDPQAISMTTDALFYYSIGMIGFGLREVISRAFYALGDTKTPVINAVMSVTINIILNIILSKYMGIGGLAFATSISSIFCTILLFISFRKKVGAFGFKSISITFIKVLFTSLIMGIVVRYIYNNLFIYISSNLSLVLSIFIGAIIYFVMISFMNIREVNNTIESVKKRLKIIIK